ncbi:MAG: hypothetical protein LBH44_03530 [Treponema sp.]|nr:hypothetical protein [Treponema sp.]
MAANLWFDDPLHRWLVWFDMSSPPELIEKVVAMDLAIMAASERQAFLTRSQEAFDRAWLAKMEMDRNQRMYNAHQKGLAEGLIEAKFEIARNALVEGIPIELIQKITGLDPETIKNLQEPAL